MSKVFDFAWDLATAPVDFVGDLFKPPKLPKLPQAPQPQPVQMPQFPMIPPLIVPPPPAPPTTPAFDEDQTAERAKVAKLAQVASKRQGRRSTIIAGHKQAAEEQKAEGLSRKQKRLAAQKLGADDEAY